MLVVNACLKRERRALLHLQHEPARIEQILLEIQSALGLNRIGLAIPPVALRMESPGVH